MSYPNVKKRSKYVGCLLIIGLLYLAIACSATQEAQGMQFITGSVWYRERMMLPPNAEIQVTLEDVARMDVPSEMIATTRFRPQTGPPWEFTLPYDPAKIHDKGRYALRVRIEVDGRLMFINTEHISAFGKPQGEPLKIPVSRVGGKRGK